MKDSLYTSNQFLCYNEIENDRKNNKKYVIYDFYRIYNGLPDEYMHNEVWCRYMVDCPTGDVSKSRLAIMKQKYLEYDLYSKESGNSNFRELQKVLANKGFEKYIAMLNKLCSINVNGDTSCELMITAGATINYGLLIEDINKLPNNSSAESGLQVIIRRLTAQVNCAAINGLFTLLFCASLNKSANAYEEQISNSYSMYVVGMKDNINTIIVPNDSNVYLKYLDIKQLLSRADDNDSVSAKTLLMEFNKLLVSYNFEYREN